MTDPLLFLRLYAAGILAFVEWCEVCEGILEEDMCPPSALRASSGKIN